MAVWLKARRDFTFKGTPYRSGQVFLESALVAVQMQVMRAVEFAKAPVTPPPPDPAPKPTRRRNTYATKQMVAESPYQETEPTPTAPEPPPAPEPIIYGEHRRVPDVIEPDFVINDNIIEGNEAAPIDITARRG